MNIIAGISISILATAITGIIVGTTTAFPKTDSVENTNIDYGSKMDDTDKELGYKPLLLGPSYDSSGECPSPARWSNKNKQCCCRPSCCWDQCEAHGQWLSPPEDCLEGVQNSKWVFNDSLGYYQAFLNAGTYI